MDSEKGEAKRGSPAFRGAALASLACAFFYLVYYGATEKTGIGPVWQVGIAILICGLGIFLVGLLAALAIVIGRKLPRLFRGHFFAALGALFKSLPIPSTAAIFGSSGFILLLQTAYFQYPLPFAIFTGPLLMGLQALLAAALAILLSGGWKGIGLLKRSVLVLAILLPILLDVGLARWLASPGSVDSQAMALQMVPPLMPQIKAADPSLPGPFKVDTLCYGSGSDRRRPEFGRGVAIRTPAIDASSLFKDYKGWKAKARNAYWGFGLKKLPLNGRVWFPDGSGPFPLVLIVHGNHEMSVSSDAGYAYLGELLASQGFIAVSVDENFFNGGFAGGWPGKKSENAARGWMLLQHLKFWKGLQEKEGNPFYGKVALDRIALVGHSRGGEAVAHAAAMNMLPYFTDDFKVPLHFGFGIRTVIAIAPVDGQYRPSQKPLDLKDINYFTIQGSHDADMNEFHGLRQYQRVALAKGGVPECKAALYVYRANHGQFNTSWGKRDFSPPSGWFLNVAPLMDGAEQRQIAKVFISAFLQATLQDKKEYLPMFRDWRFASRFLPKTIYLNRFEDNTFVPLAGFEEDINLITGSQPGAFMDGVGLAVWNEERLDFRTGSSQENHAVRLGWRRGQGAKGVVPSFCIAFPELSLTLPSINGNTSLVMCLADTGEEPPPGMPGKGKPGPDPWLNFTLEVVDASGGVARLPFSVFYSFPPPLRARMTKWSMMESFIMKRDAEPVLASYEFPLRAFQAANPAFQPQLLSEVRLVFDKSPVGMIYVDDIGLCTREPIATPAASIQPKVESPVAVPGKETGKK